LRPLQSQHQLDQLFLAQTLKIAAAHDNRESAKPALRKGLGNYFREIMDGCLMRTEANPQLHNHWK
jgi:Arc/MetJ family transcription regulator